MEICKTKNWGNSIGIIVPRNVVKSLDIKPNEEIEVQFVKKKKNVLEELFGALDWGGKSTEEILKEGRKLESKFE